MVAGCAVFYAVSAELGGQTLTALQHAAVRDTRLRPGCTKASMFTIGQQYMVAFLDCVLTWHESGTFEAHLGWCDTLLLCYFVCMSYIHRFVCVCCVLLHTFSRTFFETLMGNSNDFAYQSLFTGFGENTWGKKAFCGNMQRVRVNNHIFHRVRSHYWDCCIRLHQRTCVSVFLVTQLNANVP